MKIQGNVAFSSVIVVAFVVLVGALGYTYLVNMNARVAIENNEALVAPQIAKTSDLDKAIEVLDDAELTTDMAELEALENQL